MLVEKGVQASLQRIAICQYVMSEADHATADDVFVWAQKNMAKISQATVYNTLGTLTDAGILRTFKFPHSEKVVYDCNTIDHFHFYDEKTGKLVDIDPDSISVKIELPKKYKIHSMDVFLKGEIK